MVLVQKWPFFQLFFLGNIGQENVFYDILERKNACLGYKNKMFKKSKNWHFLKGVNPRFGPKNGHFSNHFLGGQYRPRKCLLRYSRVEKRPSRLYKKEVQKVEKLTFFQRKNAFLGNKHKKSKKSKNWHFSKAVIPGFAPKMAIFPTFLFRQYKPGKCLLWYSRTKKRFSWL